MRKLFRRLYALIHRRRLHRELAEEMSAHREMMPAGRREHFGSTLRLQEEARDQWGWAWLDHFRQDLVYGARSLRRSPAFALTAIAVLSLGIGANLAELHIFEAFLHTLHVRDPGSLYRFQWVGRQRPVAVSFSIPEVEFYRRHNTMLSAVIAETQAPGVYQAQDSVELRCVAVSGNFFGELGIAPLYGRLLNDEDDKPGAPPVAVLSYDYWRGRFGSDAGVVMKTIRLNDKPTQVVGIGPPDFGGLGMQVNVWVSTSQYSYLTGEPGLLVSYRMRRSSMYGRLRQGVSPDAAQAEFRALAAELHRERPESVDDSALLKFQPVGGRAEYTPVTILVLSTIILLVLLVLFSACANLGNMLLARGLARQRELEIRLAIGAGRWRLVRQLMTESLLLAALSAAAALFVGRAAAILLLRITGAPSDMRIATDWRIILSAAGLALAATLAFGVAPAIQTVKGGPRATRARKILVSVQVAASYVLLILSLFFMRAIQESFRTELSFDPTGLAVVDPSFYLHRFSASQARQAAREIAARLRQAPGIDAVSVATNPPLPRSHSSTERFGAHQLYWNAVDPSYFPLARLPLLAGRPFGAVELDAAVVSESAARTLWPNQSPLGESILIRHRARTVVGVVKDSGVNLMMNPESVEVYTAIDDEDVIYSTILAHAANHAEPNSGMLRSAAAIPGIAPQVFTFRGLLDQHLKSLRTMVTTVNSLAATATLLALLGIFGLLAFTVAQRTREIGVHMALGARSLDILRIVLGQYVLPFGIGGAVGVAVAAGAVKVFRSLVYGFIPFDLLSFGAGLLLFAAVAVAACIAPIRRALRIDPASALRYE